MLSISLRSRTVLAEAAMPRHGQRDDQDRALWSSTHEAANLVVTPSKTARYISFRVGSSARRAARASVATITLTWGAVIVWHAPGMPEDGCSTVSASRGALRVRNGSRGVPGTGYQA
jgi:hypothetical protein